MIMDDIKTKFINGILQRRWLSHLIFWLLLLMFYSISTTALYGSFIKGLSHNAIMLIPQMLAAYTFVYFQIPKLLYKKRYLLFILSFILGCYVFSALARVMVIHIIEELYREPPFGQEPVWEILTDIKRLYKYYFYSVFLPVFVMASIKLLKERFEDENKREILEKEKVSAELNFFKAQIHPHFLFNTLNNLYTLTLKKSDKASDTVLAFRNIGLYVIPM